MSLSSLLFYKAFCKLGASSGVLPPRYYEGTNSTCPQRGLIIPKGIHRDNGKEAGSYYLGFRVEVLYWDNGTENGNYYLGFTGFPILIRSTLLGSP